MCVQLAELQKLCQDMTIKDTARDSAYKCHICTIHFHAILQYTKVKGDVSLILHFEKHIVQTLNSICGTTKK